LSETSSVEVAVEVEGEGRWDASGRGPWLWLRASPVPGELSISIWWTSQQGEEMDQISTKLMESE
jgi:hypothetical protein